MAKQKKKHKRQNPKILALWLVLMGLFIGELLFYTWCRVQSVRVGYEITEEAERHGDLIAAQNHLRIEISRLKSPERISRIARLTLGLATPAPEQVIVIHEIN